MRFTPLALAPILAGPLVAPASAAPQDVPLSSLRRDLESRDAGVRRAAAVALAERGAEADALLRRTLEHDDRLLAAFAAIQLGRGEPAAEKSIAALVETLDPHGRQAGFRVEQILADWEQRREPLLGQIEAAVRGSVDLDPAELYGAEVWEYLGVQEACIHALSDQGLPALEALLEACSSSRGEAGELGTGYSRLRAALALVARRTGPPAVAPLEAATESASPGVRAAAAVALGAVGEPARSALAALRRLAKEQDPHVRWRAVEAIGSLDAPRTQVAELLQRAREDEHPMVRVRAAHASAAIGVRARTCMAVLREAADDGDPNVVRAALDALAQFDGRDQRRAVALLIECLASELADTRRAAANALARVGPAAGDALPELRALAEDSEEEEAVRLAARDAIAAIAVR